MKTYIVWLTGGIKFVMTTDSFFKVFEGLTFPKGLNYPETMIKRIYCVEDDRSMVFFNNVSERKKNG